jgi:hypothetical protein
MIPCSSTNQILKEVNEMTQLKDARSGIVTPEMQKVAEY